MNLIPRFIYGELDLTAPPYAIEFGSDLGNPENVVEVVQTLLSDGEVLESDRTSNRTLTLPVLIEESDLFALAQAEAALVVECDKARNVLTVDPGDGFGAATVFDTFRAQPRWQRDDNMERQGYRRFLLTIPALPYPRSATLTTEVAEGIPSAGVVIDDGTSTMNWSTPAAKIDPAPSPMLSVVDGRLAVQPWASFTTISNGVSFHTYSYRATRTLSEVLDAGAYVSVEVGTESPHDPEGDAGLNSVTYTTSIGTFTVERSGMIVEAVSNGVVRYTWRVDSALTLTSILFSGRQYRPASESFTPYPNLLLDNLAVAESATLGNQVLKTIMVGGSARTTGALHVAAPSDSVALGTVIAYTIEQSKVAAGFRPDMAQWALPGASTGTVDGRAGVFTGITASYGAAGSPVFVAPASVFKSGACTIGAMLYRVNPTLGLTVEASLMLGATVVATQELVVSSTIVEDQWAVQILGTLYLPPQPIQSPSADATVRFRFKGDEAPSGFDDLYVFPVEGDLSLIDCGTGTVGPGASSHLWIDTPSPDQPQGGYWRGTTPTREDALSAWSTTVVPGTLTLPAGPVLAFVASSEAQGPTVTFDYFKAWFGNAGD